MSEDKKPYTVLPISSTKGHINANEYSLNYQLEQIKVDLALIENAVFEAKKAHEAMVLDKDDKKHLIRFEGNSCNLKFDLLLVQQYAERAITRARIVYNTLFE
jgi:hypothetical protein